MNFITIVLSQTTLFRILTFIFGSLVLILTVLLFWIYFYPLILAFALRWFSLHGETLVTLSQLPLNFVQTEKEDARCHCIAYDYSCADWNYLHDDSNHVSLEVVSVAAFELSNWVQFEIESSLIFVVFSWLYCCHSSSVRSKNHLLLVPAE